MVAFGTDTHTTAAVGLLITLLAAVAMWFCATAYLAPAAGDAAVLMDLSIDPATLAGIQYRERTHCQRRARQLLWDLSSHRGLRAVMWRDGALWLVVAGEGLSVTAGQHVGHHVRHRGPVTDETASSGTLTAPPGMVVRRNTTVDPSAISTSPNPIVRYTTVAAAQAALPADTTTERHYIFVTGLAADPSAYIVRVMRAAPRDGLLPTKTGASAVVLRDEATIR